MTHPSAPPHPRSRFQIWRNRVWWVLWGLFCVMWLVMCIRGRQPSDPPLPLTATVGRGGIIMGVELPDGSPPPPRRFYVAYVPPGNRSFPEGYSIGDIRLTEAEWQPLETLRSAWCQNPPNVAAAAPDSAMYTVALQCPGFFAKEFQVSEERLPTALRMLVDRVFPPTPTPRAP